MKLAVIFPVLNQFHITECAIDLAVHHSVTNPEIIAIDNASDISFSYDNLTKIVRLDSNIGVYPVFWEALKYTSADILAFFHTDLLIGEKGWDEKLINAFVENPNLGLVGFVGSDEIDGSGGRGLGTMSNFCGWVTRHLNKTGEEKTWEGSRAEIHGKRVTGLIPAAVVDGCAMVFRREVLKKIPQRENFPIHHFYDRLLSCEVREHGYDIAVLGVGCDHISGQTVNQENAYSVAAEKWCNTHGIAKTHNWDDAVYHEAERQWLNEYRDHKHLIPFKV